MTRKHATKKLPFLFAALAIGLTGAMQSASAQPGNDGPDDPDGYDDDGYDGNDGNDGYDDNNGYQAPPPPRRAYATAPYRFGLTVSVDLGLGSMTAESGPIDCIDCDVEPVAIGGSFEIGAMLNPRLALLLHLRGTIRTLDADGVNILYNTMGLVAAKYWLTRALWIKGGLGFAALGITYDDGFVADDEQLDEGGAGLLGIGYEILHTPRFAIDLAATATSSVFSGIDDTINTGIISLGASWF